MTTILVSGSRNAGIASVDAIGHALGAIRDTTAPGQKVTLRHGAARGVDTLAAELATAFGWAVDPYPAAWQECGDGCPPRPHLRSKNGYTWCPHAGHRRNAAMLTATPRPTYILAFPAVGSAGKGGTWNFMQQAVDLGYVIDRVVPLLIEAVPTLPIATDGRHG